MQILDAFRHPVSRSRARSANLQDAAMRLHIEGEDVAAQIGNHVLVHQDIPERANVFVADLALIGPRKAVDGKHRVMAKNELMSGITMVSERCFQPRELDMALTAK